MCVIEVGMSYTDKYELFPIQILNMKGKCVVKVLCAVAHKWERGAFFETVCAHSLWSLELRPEKDSMLLSLLRKGCHSSFIVIKNVIQLTRSDYCSLTCFAHLSHPFQECYRSMNRQLQRPPKQDRSPRCPTTSPNSLPCSKVGPLILENQYFQPMVA